MQPLILWKHQQTETVNTDSCRPRPQINDALLENRPSLLRPPLRSPASLCAFYASAAPRRVTEKGRNPPNNRRGSDRVWPGSYRGLTVLQRVDGAEGGAGMLLLLLLGCGCGWGWGWRQDRPGTAQHLHWSCCLVLRSGTRRTLPLQRQREIQRHSGESEKRKSGFRVEDNVTECSGVSNAGP